VDGRINVRTTDGEIACFGGRLPFYNFSGPPHSIRYVKGTPIHLEMNYRPNGLSQASPATMEYVLVYNNITYSSGVLNFDQGNPGEDPPYGLWGMLNDARVGGFIQYFVGMSAPDLAADATWTSIYFHDCVVGVEPANWGAVKSLYR
jgi:hypothetical protein